MCEVTAKVFCCCFIFCDILLFIIILLFITVFADCYEVLLAGKTQSGVYSINPDGKEDFDVFCDQSTKGGGWVVFQKRFDGLVDFFRNWKSYRDGFGNLTGEFWLGLDKIHRLSSLKRNTLHVDLGDFNNFSAYADYDKFKVLSEQDLYELDLGKYTGIFRNIAKCIFNLLYFIFNESILQLKCNPCVFYILHFFG